MIITVSTPCADYHVHHAWVATMAHFSTWCRDNGHTLNQSLRGGCSNLILARNCAAHEALKKGSDLFITYDADQFTTDLPKLVEGIESDPQSIQALPIRKKRRDKLDWNFRTLPGEPEVVGEWARVAAVGAGAMAIHTQMLLDMVEHAKFFVFDGEPVADLYGELYDESNFLPGKLSEDYSFCVRALKKDIETWIYVPARVKHYGDASFEGVMTV